MGRSKDHEKFHSDRTNGKFKTLGSLSAYVRTIASAHREVEDDVDIGNLKLLAPSTIRSTTTRTQAAFINSLSRSQRAQFASAFAATPGRSDGSKKSTSRGLCFACDKGFITVDARVSHRAAGCAASPQCTEPNCTQPRNHLTKYHDIVKAAFARRAAAADDSSTSSDTASVTSGSAAIAGAVAEEASVSRRCYNTALFTGYMM